MAHDVFISHSQKDKAVADAVCAALEAGGHRCWIAPRDVLPGADWSASIVKAIKAAQAMVLVFSNDSNNSDHVRREMQTAANHDVAIIPFRIEDVKPSMSFEYFLGTQHWLDAMTPPLENHLKRLDQVIAALLEKIPTRATSTEAPPEPPEPFVPRTPLATTKRFPWGRISWVGGVVLAMLVAIGAFSLFRGAPAGETDGGWSPGEPPPPRTLHFPEDTTVGTLRTRPWGSDSDLRWEVLSEASGAVYVPSYVELSLDVRREHWAEALAGVSPQDLQELRLTGVSGELMQKIGGFTSLRSLKIHGADAIDDEDLVSLASFKNLDTLWLTSEQLVSKACVPIGNEGVKYLTRLKSLRELWLNYTLVDEQGLRHLVGLPRLERLCLFQCKRVTDGAIEPLAAIKTLKFLDIRETLITDAGFQVLQEALPNCEINR